LSRRFLFVFFVLVEVSKNHQNEAAQRGDKQHCHNSDNKDVFVTILRQGILLELVEANLLKLQVATQKCMTKRGNLHVL